MSNFEKNVLITGGYGFIGSHLVRHFVNKYENYRIVNLDAMTYAANKDNLKDIEGNKRYVPVVGNICDKELVEKLFYQYDFDIVIHMAAESHVDKSMLYPNVFAETNILGTMNLMNVAKKTWGGKDNKVFLNMITDEIFGSLDVDSPKFNENTVLDPHSPYSTSKAAQYLFGKTYFEAYDLPVISLCCGNAIGPNQFLEKLVPLTIDRLIHNEEIPLYGEGKQMRDWTSVYDICEAIDLLCHKGKIGDLYCIGGDNCVENIFIIKKIILRYCLLTGKQYHDMLKLVHPIKDPRGKAHDFRYDIDHRKITKELGWIPKHSLTLIINQTVKWYMDNQDWCDNIRNRKQFSEWMEEQYGNNNKQNQ